MKLQTLSILSAAAALLLFPAVVPAQSGQLSTEAPGVVMLTGKVDANKLKSGGTFETKLLNNVHLSNGVEIPRGSKLIATVADDDMQLSGKLKVALRFTAVAKDGKTVPIKATILSISTDIEPVENNTEELEATMAIPNNLTGQPDKIEQQVDGSLSLHANANSGVSGVLTTDKDDIKLPYGTKFELAIAPGQ